MREHLGWCLPDSDQHFAAWLQQHPNNSYQQGAVDLALQHCSTRDLVLDVGANIGLFTTRLCQHFARVVAFEPTTAVYDCLRKNCSAHHNVEIMKVGLGDRTHLVEISAPTDHRNCGVYSMVDFQGHDHRSSELVPVLKLDDLELAPDLIKIDTQGYEPFVLRGAVRTLREHAPVLLLEVEGKAVRHQIQQVLQPLGYAPIDAVRHDQIWIKS